MKKKIEKVFLFNFEKMNCYSDGRFRLGDEIINVNGKSLRGLTMDEARNVLSSYGSQIIDIILARDPEVPEKSVSSIPVGPSSGIGPTPVERRRRRKLPLIERPRSAPVHASPETILRSGHGSTNCLNCSNSNSNSCLNNTSNSNGNGARNRHRSYRDGSLCGGSVHDLQIRDLDDDDEDEEDPPVGSTPVQQQLRTVIKIGEHGQRIEHHHHHFHHSTKSVNSASCVDTPYSMTPAQSVENFHHSTIDDRDEDDEQVKNFLFQ
jgi:hypothetical protein